MMATVAFNDLILRRTKETVVKHRHSQETVVRKCSQNNSKKFTGKLQSAGAFLCILQNTSR